MDRIVPIEGTLCSACGEKLFVPAGGDEAPLCAICRRAAPRFKRAVAYGSYAGELRDLIHLFKYRQIRSAGRVLAGMLHQALAPLDLPANVTVVPVPLWPGKRRVRGFNQSEELAQALVMALNRTAGKRSALAGSRTAEAGTCIQLDTTSLVRKRDTASQTGLTRQQRHANLRGAFAVVHPERVAGRTVLIVDDVMTTGTTAGECARVLLRAGAKEVFVATVARATREVSGGVPAVFAQEGTQGHA